MTKEEKYKEALLEARAVLEPCLKYSNGKVREALDSIDKELKSFESEDEMIRKELKEAFEAYDIESKWNGIPVRSIFAWLEKQKEKPKTADSIPSDCTSDAKCEDRWHKVSDSLPDNGRLVLANDCLGNTLLARYDGEGNWEVSVYDNEDYYCRNTITKWCEIPSEKQKKQKPEWSEKDEAMRDNILRLLSCFVGTVECDSDPSLSASYPAYQREMDWLKSLRPSWKPSEEQMDRLFSIVAALRKDYCDDMADFLANLYADLKKLGVKEEPEYYQHFDPDC